MDDLLETLSNLKLESKPSNGTPVKKEEEPVKHVTEIEEPAKPVKEEVEASSKDESIPIESTEFYYISKTGLVYPKPDEEDSKEESKSARNVRASVQALTENELIDKCTTVEECTITDEEREKLVKIFRATANEASDADKENASDPVGAILGDTAARLQLANVLGLVDRIAKSGLNNGIALFDSSKFVPSSDVCLETLITSYLLKKHELKRILTLNLNHEPSARLQKAFYSDSKVLTISVHTVDTESSQFDKIGDQNGKGFNVNIPIDEASTSNSDMMSILYNLILPISYEFNPQFVLVSTNFEAVSRNSVSSKLLSHFTNSLQCVADGKICFLVDSDSNSDSFSVCVSTALRSLMGFPCMRLESLAQPDSKAVKLIMNCLSVLRPYWCCLQFLNDNDTVLLNDHIESLKSSLDKSGLDSSVATSSSAANTPKHSPRLESAVATAESIEINLSEHLRSISLASANSRTCICTDDRMTRHYNLIEPVHPERPDRLRRIIKMLKERNLYERCVEVPSREVRDEELLLCHKKEYIEELKTLENKSQDELIAMSKNPDSVYFHADTFSCAQLAAGCLLSVVDAVCSHKFTNGAAVIRPPGHHANSDHCSGFCFFNSVAVAARYAQKNYENVKKVLILDWDVHHGNGTQEIFEEDDSVLFISLHRYDNGTFYPADSPSNFDCIGHEKGKGFTVNIPWSQATYGDAEYLAAFLRVVMPIAYQFNPDLVFISAGFDAADGDPLGGYKISPSGYAQMTKMLSSLANGNVILALEGGYNLNSISESMSSCVSSLLGDVCPSLPPVNAKLQAYKTIRDVIGVQKTYWSCFQFDGKLPACEFVKKYKLKRNEIPSSVEQDSALKTRLRSRQNGANSPKRTPFESPTMSIPVATSPRLANTPKLANSPRVTASPRFNLNGCQTTPVAQPAPATNSVLSAKKRGTPKKPSALAAKQEE